MTTVAPLSTVATETFLWRTNEGNETEGGDHSPPSSVIVTKMLMD